MVVKDNLSQKCLVCCVADVGSELRDRSFCENEDCRWLNPQKKIWRGNRWMMLPGTFLFPSLQAIFTRTMRKKRYYYYLLTVRQLVFRDVLSNSLQDITLINDKVIAVEKPGG